MLCPTRPRPPACWRRLGEEAWLNRWRAGRITYEVDARVVKELFYCNGCIKMADNDYVDLCAAWRFG